VAAALGLLLLFLAATPLMLSKERLCNAAIGALADEEVTICFDERDTSPLGCSLRYMTLRFAHSPVAKVKTFEATPWHVEARGIRLEGMAAGALPPRIASVAFDPLEGKVVAKGDFGTLEGRISYLERKARFVLTPSSLMRSRYAGTLRQFKRKNGKYLYETAF
jgi:hypothetical protein